jgi:hypothetical protein
MKYSIEKRQDCRILPQSSPAKLQRSPFGTMATKPKPWVDDFICSFYNRYWQTISFEVFGVQGFHIRTRAHCCGGKTKGKNRRPVVDQEYTKYITCP